MHKNQIYLLIIAGLVLVLGYEVWNISTEDDAVPKAKQVVLYKNPGCQCCSRWATHLEQAGFTVTEKPTDRLPSIKAEQGVPNNMASCHTALVGGYIVEGHVPIQDVQRLLKEKPDARGLAVPGMPAGSPGMESANPVHYNVYLIGNDGSETIYAKH